jgi:integrase/recombinase XerD
MPYHNGVHRPVYKRSEKPMNLYKRHKAECQHKNGSGKDKDRSHRCACAIYIELNNDGKQTRSRVEDRAGQPLSSWSEAEKLTARNTEETGNPATAKRTATAVTIRDAAQQFLDSKKAEGHEQITLAKYKLTLDRLAEYSEAQGVTELDGVTSGILLKWFDTQEHWKAPSARLSFHARIVTFFGFCHSRELVLKNPMKAEAFKQNVRRYGKDAKKRRQETVSPLTQAECEKLFNAVATTPNLTAANKERVRVMMKLQRYSGLALVDASCLEREELKHERGTYRIVTSRQKSDEAVSNIIPAWLGKELLTVKNGNPKYFFWTGESLAGSVSSHYDKLYRKVFIHAEIETDGQLSHRFRHTYAVELLKSGVGMRNVSKALGHASIQTTERYYAKWEPGQQAKLDAALSGALK